MLINSNANQSTQIESIAEEGRVGLDGQAVPRTTAESDSEMEETELLSPEEIEEVRDRTTCTVQQMWFKFLIR